MRITRGSQKYGTEIMKEEEVVCFVEAAVENGSGIPEAVSDMRMIDTMLHMKRLHLAVHPVIKTTKSGFYRKGSSLYNILDGLIDARVNNEF